MMINKCNVEMFGNKIGTIYEKGNQIYFKFDKACKYKISPFIFMKIDDKEHNFNDLKFNEGLAGVFADSLPDRHGMNIINDYFLEKRIKPTAIDKLLFIGENGLGALRYKPNKYKSEENQKYKEIKTLQELHIESKKLISNSYQDIHISQYHRNLLISNTSAGGARAKAIIMYNPKTDACRLYNSYSRHQEIKQDFIHGIVKFDELESNNNLKDVDDVRIEYVYSLIAKKCNIDMPNTYLTKDDGDGKRHFVIERFDNKNGRALHMHSLAGLYNHNFDDMLDYEDIFRMAIYLKTPKKDLEEIYKRMVFNYVLRNQDDHAKNFSFLMNENQEWYFSPAYDLMYNNGKKFTFEHKMSFNGKLGKDVLLEDFEELANLFKIKNYKEIIKTTENVCEDNLQKLLIKYNVKDSAVSQIMSDVRSLSFSEKYGRGCSAFKKLKFKSSKETEVKTTKLHL